MTAFLPSSLNARPRRGPRWLGAIGPVAVVLLLLAIAPGVSGGGPLPRLPPPLSPASDRTAMAAGAASSLGAASASLREGAGPAHGQPWDCSGLSAGAAARCGPSASAGSDSGGAPDWRPIGFAPPPATGFLAFDAADNYTVLLQESGYTTAVGTTWTYSSGAWTELNLSTGPGWCPSPAMTYDGADGYLLYLGSFNCTSANQEWTFAAGVWTQIHPAGAPHGAEAQSLAYDPALGAVVLFGGLNVSTCATFWGCNDTWEYAHGVWTDLTASLSPLPPARAGASMVYDAADGYLVMFGGTGQVNGSYVHFSDTWAFNGTGWSKISTTSPAPVLGLSTPAVAYDPAAGAVIVLETNSAGPLCTSCNQTWSYRAGAWTNLSTAGPSPPAGPWASAFDPSTGQLLAFGYPTLGYNGPQGSLWAYDGGTWADIDRGFGPPPTDGAAMAFDPSDGYVVLFGGCTPYGQSQYSCFSNDTWTYRGGTWTNVTSPQAPPARIYPSLAYDAADGYLLLFGGLTLNAPYYSTEVALSDTWEFVNGSWSELSPASHPSARSGADMVYDAADGYVLLFGGFSPGASAADSDTWTFGHGIWSNITTAVTGAPVDPSPSVVYDVADGYVMLFGTYLSAAPWTNSSVWTYFAGTWTDRSASGALPGSPPLSLVGQPLVFDAARQAVELYTAWGNGTVYEYEAGRWAAQVPAISPPRVGGGQLAYDAADQYLFLFGGSLYNAGGSTTSTSWTDYSWAWGNSSGPGPLTISGLTADPSPVDVGVTTQLLVTVTGGVAPYSFAWIQLPSGCSSVNRSQVLCAPSAPGDLTIEVTVTDANGTRVASTLDLRVTADPVVSALTASPATITLGERTVLSATATGGAGPLSYQYTGLPPGCPSQDVPTLPCTPTQNGSFLPSLVVSDGELSSPALATPITIGCSGPSGGPQICEFSATPSALVLGNNTTLHVGTSNAPANVTYTYSGLPPGCPPANASNISCAPTGAGTFTLRVVVTSPGGATATSSTPLTVFPVGGGVGVTILAFSAAPNNFTVGNSTVLQVVATGGTGNYSYSYSGLPPNCLSEDVPSLPCSPSTPGTYRTYALVTDNGSSRVGAYLTLQVAGAPPPVAPTLSGFVASPASVTVGETTTFLVSLSGGTPPFAYSYSDLPPGCTSQSTPTLACSPTESGVYTVRVTVTGPTGLNVSTTTTLNVGPTSTGLGPGTGLEIPFGLPELLAGAFVAGAIVIGGLFALYRRRARDRAEADEIVRSLSPTDDERAPPGR